ncbi:PQQ-dependent sugar dehydrogenase [Porifericola rhodea]|uniref:PQQ-dependent sugar dehydrogenase n=1 Tax=Porifericola rhodea TaxID=930972 RepID=UPI002666E359|nr:PQQ-dependent sugar dehydrogenase [Porifericola rhodea]WKN33477.1 PQQ-dependent sugar dehydrogenase [Porifericola rhodea]
MNGKIQKASLLSLALLIYSFILFSPLDYGLDQVSLKEEFLDGVFPRLGSTTTTWTLEQVFPNFSHFPINDLVEVPGSNKLLALGKAGKIWIFDNDESNGEPRLVLNINKKVEASGDDGLLGIAFHPKFNDTSSIHAREIYIFYTYKYKNYEEPLYDRLSRFKFSENLDSIISSSEEILIQQYDRSYIHNGGDMFFDNEGYLYVSLGDEGEPNDHFGNSQKINSALFGGIIRIDVDMDSSRSHPIRRYPQTPYKPESFPDNINDHYMIPNDNPWLSEEGDYLEEFFAIGFRSPHKMYYDTLTENIWVADVGQAAREEISLIKKGSNAQWAYKEGTKNFLKSKPKVLIGTETPPIFDYGRDLGGAIIGGFVYRGDKYPSLNNKYIFADFVSRNIWALDPENGNTVTQLSNSGGKGGGIVSLLNDSSGNIYILTLRGVIFKLIAPTTNKIPKLLSETKAFSDMGKLTPSPGIIPYEVNSPLWSDGAHKKRWISIPNKSKGISYSQDSTWEFPVGTVFIKHFELPVKKDSAIRLETRFFIIDEEGKGYGLTYKWNQEGTDAELIDNGELISKEFTLIKEGVKISQTWNFPSRDQCITCHNGNAGQVLGVKTSQLNKEKLYESTGIRDNQLRTWNHLELFSENLDSVEFSTLPALASIHDTTATLEVRVKSYLDANCSYCHRPEGVEAAFDARSSTPLSLQGLINQDIVGRNSLTGNKVVKPHDLDSSELWLRDNSLSENKMPPIGRNTLDVGYLKVLKSWIMSLQPYTTEEEVVVCEGDSYIFPDGTSLTNIDSSMTHSSQFIASNTLDSTIITHIVVNKIDTTISVIDSVLIANEDEAATYQWLVHEQGSSIIEGETSQSYIPKEAGTYSVIITKNNCSVRSEVKVVEPEIITGIEKNDFGSELNIYPNPTEGHLTISIGDKQSDGLIRITDVSGKTTLEKPFENQKKIELYIDGESGSYILNITGETGKAAVVKILKK